MQQLFWLLMKGIFLHPANCKPCRLDTAKAEIPQISTKSYIVLGESVLGILWFLCPALAFVSTYERQKQKEKRKKEKRRKKERERKEGRKEERRKKKKKEGEGERERRKRERKEGKEKKGKEEREGSCCDGRKIWPFLFKSVCCPSCLAPVLLTLSFQDASELLSI